jgi:hypothetical protein
LLRKVADLAPASSPGTKNPATTGSLSANVPIEGRAANVGGRILAKELCERVTDPTPHIKSWAIQQGWKPEHAAMLEALSRKVWNLKGKPSLSNFYNANERYARWRSA